MYLYSIKLKMSYKYIHGRGKEDPKINVFNKWDKVWHSPVQSLPYYVAGLAENRGGPEKLK